MTLNAAKDVCERETPSPSGLVSLLGITGMPVFFHNEGSRAAPAPANAHHRSGMLESMAAIVFLDSDGRLAG